MNCKVKNCRNKHHARGYCVKHYRFNCETSKHPAKRKAKRGEPEKFIQKVCETTNETDCCIWPFGENSYGYGSIRVNGATMSAHRYALIKHSGRNPDDMQACHGTCHNRLCVNPHHLEWKDAQGNQIDRVRDETHNRGERCGTAKLTESDVRSIRLMISENIKTREIAERYGVSRRCINSIRNGDSWAWLDANDRRAAA